MTLEQAKALKRGDVLHYGPRCKVFTGPRGGRHVTVERWRVNGKVKRWKRSPDRIAVPLKHGLYAYSTMGQHDVDSFHLASDCPEGIAY